MKVCSVHWCIAQTQSVNGLCAMHAELPPRHSQETRVQYLERWRNRKRAPKRAPLEHQEPLLEDELQSEPNVAQPVLRKGTWN